MASLTSTNGVNHVSQPTTVGKPDDSAPQAGSTKMEDRTQLANNHHKLDELPPELVHIVDGFYPLGRLLERSAQECYNDLDETINALADIPSQINGEHATSSAGVVSAGNAQKRLRWIEFANTQRERFMKLLVLVRWSRQVNDVGKLIDIFNWMRTQDQLWDTVDDAMLNLRRSLETEKIPRPDLETALETLVMGKSSKMPDLGYIQQNALTAEEILETLHNINVILHLRLNIHETLPPHLQNYRIASGRVTFIIPNEFEVDLSIADEDPSTQFYFIDFRFLFSPTSEIPNGNVRAQFEARVNETLAMEGLTGCYDFFHDFVLTHKVNVLRRQAMTLNRTSWIGSLVVEQVHRSLIIQYWADRPDPKSWIEVGVASNRSKKTFSSLLPQPQSSLQIKWTRSGKEVTGNVDLDINLNTATLDCAHIIHNIIARHSTYILQTISASVPGSIVFDDDDQESTDQQQQHSIPVLELPLHSKQTISLRIEPTSGKFAMAPLSDQISKFVNELNSLSSGPLLPLYTGHIRQRLPTLVIDRMLESARRWSVDGPIFDGPFPQSRLNWLENAGSCCFLPNAWRAAGSQWRIGFTVDLSRQYEWCICQVGSSTDPHTFKNWNLFATSERDYEQPWQQYKNLAAEAWQVIHMKMVEDLLAGQYSARGAGTPVDPTILETAVFLKDQGAFEHLTRPLNLFLANDVGNDIADMMHRPVVASSAVHMPTEACKMFLASSKQETSLSTVALRDDGTFFTMLKGSPAAGPPSPDLMSQFLAIAADTIRWLCRLSAYCAIISSRGFKLIEITDTRIAFYYNQRPLLACTIHRDSEQPISLSGTPQSTRRILPHLTSMLAGFSTINHKIGAFREVAKILVLSLPLLQAVDTVQNKSSARFSLQVCVVSWSEMELVYRDIATHTPVHTLSTFFVNSSSPVSSAKPEHARDFVLVGCRIMLGKTGRRGTAAPFPVLPDLHARIEGHLSAVAQRPGGFPEFRTIPGGFTTSLANIGTVLDEVDEAVRLVEVPAAAASASEVGGVEVIEID